MAESLIRYEKIRKADELDDQKSAVQILGAEGVGTITQEQLQEFILSQIKRIIFDSAPGRWFEDFQGDGIKSLRQITDTLNALPTTGIGRIGSVNEYRTTGGSEELLYQESLDFDRFAASVATVQAALVMFSRQSAGSGTYRVRVGGTENAADGTIFATITTSHTSGYALPLDKVIGAALAKPVGPKLVKVTGTSSGLSDLAFIKAFEVVFF